MLIHQQQAAKTYCDVRHEIPRYSSTTPSPNLCKGYDFRVDDDLEAVGVEDAADVGVELVELVDALAAVDVPQQAVVEDEVVARVERGAVPLVVVRLALLAQL